MFLQTCNSIITGPFVHLHPIGAVVTKRKTLLVFTPTPNALGMTHSSTRYTLPTFIRIRIVSPDRQSNRNWNGMEVKGLFSLGWWRHFIFSTYLNVRASIGMETQTNVLFNSFIEKLTINYIYHPIPCNIIILLILIIYLHLFIYH